MPHNKPGNLHKSTTWRHMTIEGIITQYILYLMGFNQFNRINQTVMPRSVAIDPGQVVNGNLADFSTSDGPFAKKCKLF